MSDLSHRLCVAPMMDWTDCHCRYFQRLIAPHARLYTEMITTGALLHGDVARHLDFDPADALANCARLRELWGYDEINLNVGCPSERVQTGSFGARLMPVHAFGQMTPARASVETLVCFSGQHAAFASCSTALQA